MPDALVTRDTVARDLRRRSPEWVKDALDVVLAAGLLFLIALLVAG